MEALPFKARLVRAFRLAGRGTVACINILEGRVRVGDRLRVPIADGTARIVEVAAVEFLDVDRPARRAEVALILADVECAELVVGSELRASK